MFVLSTMATKVKVTKSMLHTLDYPNRGRRQCSEYKMAFICSLIVGISETIPGLSVSECDHCTAGCVKTQLLVQWLL